ncbi:MAG: peptidoglycan DD-metalloendopeptidase family protein [Chloroflexota bacterium]
MLRKIRILLQWATWLLLIGSFFLFGQQTARAATVPFLTNPYYGSTLAIYSYFDHDIPTNLYGYTGDNLGVVTYQGGSAQSVRYTGHAGYDYLMNWKPILASASGSVVQAQWNDPTDHSYGCGLFVKLAHTNITPNHQTIYCHLSAILVKTGDSVAQKGQIGTSGNTGSSDAPHLHFEVRVLNSNSQWLPTDPKGFATGQTDPWRVKSGVQSVNLWKSSPVVGQPTNYGSFIIQDSVTNTAKFKKWCSADATGVNCPYWEGVNIGSGGHMFYTYTNGTTVDYQAKWVPGAKIASSNNYEVFVWIPDANATSGAVRYTVYYNGGNRTIIVDQNYTTNKWVSLGIYYFLAGKGYVKVVDAAYFSGYTDPANNKIGVDAIKFIRRSDIR